MLLFPHIFTLIQQFFKYFFLHFLISEKDEKKNKTEVIKLGRVSKTCHSKIKTKTFQRSIYTSDFKAHFFNAFLQLALAPENA
jgi:hypothetical protein